MLRRHNQQQPLIPVAQGARVKYCWCEWQLTEALLTNSPRRVNDGKVDLLSTGGRSERLLRSPTCR